MRHENRWHKGRLEAAEPPGRHRSEHFPAETGPWFGPLQLAGIARFPAECLECRRVLQCAGFGDVAQGAIRRTYPGLPDQGKGLPGKGETSAKMPG